MPSAKQELGDVFVEDIQRIYNLYNSLSKHATTLECSVLAEQTVVSITVALESFISEVLVALISEDDVPPFLVPDVKLDPQTIDQIVK